MAKWLWNMLTDEKKFIGGARAILAGLGLGIESGRVPLPEFAGGMEWLGIAFVGAAVFIRSSAGRES